MAELTIPCDTFVRLATIALAAPADASPWFHSVRIENGLAIASDRKLIVVERFNTPAPGITHVAVDKVLLDQCRKEIQYHSNLHVSVLDGLGMGSAKTTLQYQHKGNPVVNAPGVANELDGWRAKVPKTLPTVAKGGMCWDADLIARLAAASPSKRINFPSIVDATEPVLVKDAVDPNWFGLFLCAVPNNIPTPVAIPEWL